MNPEQNISEPISNLSTQPIPPQRSKSNFIWLLIPLSFILGVVITLIAVKLYPGYFAELGIIVQNKIEVQNEAPADTAKNEQNEDENKDRIVFIYTYNGKKYQLSLPNENRLTYETDKDGKFIINLDKDSQLQITVDKNPLKNELGGVYGQVEKKVSGNLYRTSYFGYFYLLDLAPNCDPVITQRPCVGSYFHNDDKGALKAYLVNNKPNEVLTSQEVTNIADSMISKYLISEIK